MSDVDTTAAHHLAQTNLADRGSIQGSYESLLNNNKNNNNQKSLSNLLLNQISNAADNKSLNSNDEKQQTAANLSSASLNEKVAQLASSIYTELEKIVKLYGRDIVKDLMPIVVNILEALDVAYHEKEELLVENELLKDDYEKLLMQYEREKQSRKDTELKLFQSEDSFAEQKRDYEEKVKSLESIVRMIDLKSKNTSDHVLRLEEKENELKREYNKLHERYTELFKTHCDYLERTKILFGQEGANRLDHSSNSSIKSSNTNSSNQPNLNKNKNNLNSSTASSHLDENNGNKINANKLLDLLRSSGSSINRSDLISCLKSLNKNEITSAVSLFLSQELGTSSQSSTHTLTSDSTLTIPASVTCSLTSLNSNSTNQQQQQSQQQEPEPTHKSINDLTSSSIHFNQVQESCLNEDTNDLDRNKLNLQSSENFDEHLTPNCVEFDDTSSEINTLNKNPNLTDLDTEFEGDDESLAKNDLSLFNELSRENYDITELDDGADLTGMTREVANLIRENSELLQTKHALNVLKDDLIVRLDQFSSEMLILREEIKSLQTVKAALQLRITELEEESKKSKEELAQKTKKLEEDDESIPMSQRKRFTRAEMARVLMERNQYKERLMDLQEAVRWTEMIRATKQDHTIAQTQSPNQITATNEEEPSANSATQATTSTEQQKKKSTLWRIFSDLFGTSSQQQQQQQSNPSSSNQSSSNSQNTQSNQSPVTTLNQPKSSSQSQVLSPKISKSQSKSGIKQNQEQVVPLNDDSITSLSQEQQNEKIAKAYEFLKENPPVTEGLIKSAPKLINKKELESIREEGRMQAYGWSLPSSSKGSSSSALSITVPVPVYCRPLFKDENTLKLSCASYVNFEFDTTALKQTQISTSIDYEQLIANSQFSNFKSNDSVKSSCIWICNFNDNDTHISIFDANRPGDLVQQFTLKSLKIHSLLSVSGLTKEDLQEKEIKPLSMNQLVESTGPGASVQVNKNELNDSLDNITYIECEVENELADSTDKLNSNNNNNNNPNTSSSIKLNKHDDVKNQEQLLSTIYPTMWLGSQEGLLSVHSTISGVNHTIDKVKLKDAILCMSQMNGKVLVGLADGTVAIFQRNLTTFEWDLKNFYLVNFDNTHHSIRCIENVHQHVWAGCRNKIYVLNPENLTVPTVIEVHPRKENQVRHMSCMDNGVWVSIRLDSTLRLYHAKTHQHLQYLDIEPFITRMLGTSNLGLSLVRISSMIIVSKRLWIGTGNGVVLSIPFNSSNEEALSKKDALSSSKSVPGQVVKISSSSESNEIIPYCNLVDSQFSFHGHRDAVKFFLSVPSQTLQKNIASDKISKTYEKTETMLILSGGHGYIDFRIGDTNSAESTKAKVSTSFMPMSDIKKPQDTNEPNAQGLSLLNNKNDRSHLIVWQINDH